MRLLPVHEIDALRKLQVTPILIMAVGDTVMLHLHGTPNCVGQRCYVLCLGATEWTPCTCVSGAVKGSMRLHVAHDVSHLTNGLGEHPDEGHVVIAQISEGQGHFQNVAVQFRQPRRIGSAGPPLFYPALHVLNCKRRSVSFRPLLSSAHDEAGSETQQLPEGWVCKVARVCPWIWVVLSSPLVKDTPFAVQRFIHHGHSRAFRPRLGKRIRGPASSNALACFPAPLFTRFLGLFMVYVLLDLQLVLDRGLALRPGVVGATAVIFAQTAVLEVVEDFCSDLLVSPTPAIPLLEIFIVALVPVGALRAVVKRPAFIAVLLLLLLCHHGVAARNPVSCGASLDAYEHRAMARARTAPLRRKANLDTSCRGARGTHPGGTRYVPNTRTNITRATRWCPWRSRLRCRRAGDQKGCGPVHGRDSS